MNSFDADPGRYRLRLVVAFLVAALLISITPGATGQHDAASRGAERVRLDLKVPIVTTILERFAHDPKTTASDVRELLKHDLDAGLWVIANRSFRSGDLVGCAGFFVELPEVDDLRAARIAEV